MDGQMDLKVEHMGQAGELWPACMQAHTLLPAAGRLRHRRRRKDRSSPRNGCTEAPGRQAKSKARVGKEGKGCKVTGCCALS